MAFTFTKVQNDPGSKIALYTATTNTASAAGTISCGFVPIVVEVYDITNHVTFLWNDGMADASCRKIASDGTQTDPSTNGITPVSTTGTQGVTLGTDLHTNSSSYSIILKG
jgi:hypothetical protein